MFSLEKMKEFNAVDYTFNFDGMVKGTKVNNLPISIKLIKVEVGNNIEPIIEGFSKKSKLKNAKRFYYIV